MSREPSAAVDRTTTRRAAIASLGAIVAGRGAVAAQEARDAYRLRQGGDAIPIEPVAGDVPVADLYDYRLPAAYVSPDGDASTESGPYYQSVGTRSLQRSGTTVSFLYDGPGGLSLVVVHDRPGGDGGAVTWHVRTRPDAVDWLVRDDRYRRPDASEPASTNYDAWTSDGRGHRVDWTWGQSATDGGVLGHFPEEFAIAVDPRYGERARLHGDHYAGAVTDWEFLSGSLDDPTRHALATDEPVAVTGNWTGPDPLATAFPDPSTDRSSAGTDASREDGSTGAQPDDASTESQDGADDEGREDDSANEGGTEQDEDGRDESEDDQDDEEDEGEDDGEDDEEDERDDGGDDDEDESDDGEDDQDERDEDDGPPSWANDDEGREDDGRDDGPGRGPPPWANDGGDRSGRGDDGERSDGDGDRDDGPGRGPPPWANGGERSDRRGREDGDDD